MNFAEWLKWKDERQAGDRNSRLLLLGPASRRHSVLKRGFSQNTQIETQTPIGALGFLQLEELFLLLIRGVDWVLMRGRRLNSFGLPRDCSPFTKGLLDPLYGP